MNSSDHSKPIDSVNNNNNSWVQFDDQSNNRIKPKIENDQLSSGVSDDNSSAIKPSNHSNDNQDQSPKQQQPQQQFATIDISANNVAEIHQINRNLDDPSKSRSNHARSPDDVQSNSGKSNIVNNNSTSSSSSKSGFNNGDIIVTLYPLNDSCAWITPATFKAHLVPEELMAQPLTLTVEDYVSTMSILLSDYRFHLYITLHKRIIAIWITLSIIVLLGILASGTKGLSIFLSGILWLILNALGIFLVIFIKTRLYRMLEECISHINSIFSRHNIFLGIDDRGHFSCHKINLIFVYFDAKYCIKFLQDMLKNNNNPSTQTRTINDTSIINDHQIDNDDIYITGASGATRQISQKEKQAEKLLYRYTQRWIREYGRKRMSLSIVSQQSDQQQQSSNIDNTTVNIPTDDIPPRHCRQAKCFCQFIEELYRGRQHQQQQQQQSFVTLCLQSLLPCICSSSSSSSSTSSSIQSCCRRH